VTQDAVIIKLKNIICYKSFHLFNYIVYPHVLSADYENSQIRYLYHKTLCCFILCVSE